MADVAMTAGVSRSTVSKVLNTPERVSAPTRQRVEQAIEHLNFERSKNANSLPQASRRKSPNRSRKTRDRPSGGQGTSTDAESGLTPTTSAPLELFPPGTHVEILKMEEVVSTGLVDAFMPDRSAAWIWMDDGTGRHLIHQCDGLRLRAPK
jgi:hypothetical protein